MRDPKACYIIAEVGQAHDGSLGIAHSFIDAVSETGVDAIKFQTHIAEAESSAAEPFRVPFSYEDKTRYDYWKRMEFSIEQWHGLKEHAEERGLEFISSPFSMAAVSLLERLKVNKYKIGSGEALNLLMLRKIAETKKHILLSSGLSTYDDLSATLDFLMPYGNPVTLFQCTSKYPTTAQDIGLNVVPELRRRFGLPVGFSDHSGEIYAPLAAVALGAEMVEVHVTFDKRMFGPDSRASLSIDQLSLLVKGIRYTNEAILNPVDKNDGSNLSAMRTIFFKSLAAARPLKAGDILTFEDMESKKPANQGIPAHLFETYIGRRLVRDIQKFEFLQEGDLS